MTPFIQNMKVNLELLPQRDEHQQAILDIINDTAHPFIRNRRLRRMERHAHLHMEDDPNAVFGPTGLIDWNKVDWTKVFLTVLKIVITVLPLLLAL